MSAGFARVTRALSAAGAHEATGRAAQVAFYGLLALFPGILALLGLLPLLRLQRSSPTLEALARRGLPNGVADRVLDEIHALDARHGWALLFTLALALYYGGRALGAMLSGVALAFGRDEHHPLRAALWGVGLTGLLIAAVPVLLTLLMLVSWLLSWVATLGVLGEGLGALVGLLRWPLLFLGFQQMAIGLYRVGAGRPTGYRLLSPGSSFAAASWTLCTVGFEAFVLSFRDLGATYGSLAAVVALLLYVHLIASAVLLGAELDAQAVPPGQPS